MALIDFECIKCGKKFFEIINAKDAYSVKCSECGGDTKRVYKVSFSGKSSGSGSSGCGGGCAGCSGCH